MIVIPSVIGAGRGFEDWTVKNMYNLSYLRGQYGFYLYCPECKSANGQPHADLCKSKKVRVPACARLPRKSASKRKWKKFYKKFVEKEDLLHFFEGVKEREVKNLKINGYKIKKQRKQYGY